MNRTQSLLPQLLPTAAALASVALLTFAALNTYNSYRMTQEASQGSDAILHDRGKPQPSATSVNLGQIPGWHLFGDKAQQPKAPPKEVISAPTTPLALTLQGTFLGKSKTEGSWAIISSSDNEQTMYQVGDEIPGGATLYAVEPFQVILERNGRHESLPLPRPSMSDDPQATMFDDSPTPMNDDPLAAMPDDYQPPMDDNAADTAPDMAPPPANTPSNRQAERNALFEEMARIRKKFAK